MILNFNGLFMTDCKSNETNFDKPILSQHVSNKKASSAFLLPCRDQCFFEQKGGRVLG